METASDGSTADSSRALLRSRSKNKQRDTADRVRNSSSAGHPMASDSAELMSSRAQAESEDELYLLPRAQHQTVAQPSSNQRRYPIRSVHRIRKQNISNKNSPTEALSGTFGTASNDHVNANSKQRPIQHKEQVTRQTSPNQAYDSGVSSVVPSPIASSPVMMAVESGSDSPTPRKSPQPAARTSISKSSVALETSPSTIARIGARKSSGRPLSEGLFARKHVPPTPPSLHTTAPLTTASDSCELQNNSDQLQRENRQPKYHTRENGAISYHSIQPSPSPAVRGTFSNRNTHFHRLAARQGPIYGSSVDLKSQCNPSVLGASLYSSTAASMENVAKLEKLGESSNLVSVFERVKSLERILGIRRNCKVKTPRTIHTVAAKSVSVLPDERSNATVGDFNLNSGKDTTQATTAIECYALHATKQPLPWHRPADQQRQDNAHAATINTATEKQSRFNSLETSSSAPSLRRMVGSSVARQSRIDSGPHSQINGQTRNNITTTRDQVIDPIKKKLADFSDVTRPSAFANVLRKRHTSLLNLERASQPKPDRYLEQYRRRSARLPDAITELEDMYNKLQLEDDDLLDRAERRDLPEIHQLMWHKSKDAHQVANAHDSSPVYENVGAHRQLHMQQQKRMNDMPAIIVNSINNDHVLRRKVECRCSVHVNNNNNNYNNTADDEGQGHTDHYIGPPAMRYRTPPLRRSAVPDAVSDDLAVLRLAKAHTVANVHQAHLIDNNGQKLPIPPNLPTPSYLLCSPVYAPSVPIEQEDSGEPNIEKDDLCYRRLTQADAANVLPPPPPFGIPRYHHHSAGNDYVHAELDQSERKTFSYSIRVSHSPHKIKDDLAFRNLRKDKPGDRDSPPLLPLTTFNYLLMNTRKQLRPTRSLSTVNIPNNQCTDLNSNYWQGDTAAGNAISAQKKNNLSQSQSMTDIHHDVKKKGGGVQNNARLQSARHEHLKQLRNQQQPNTVSECNEALNYISPQPYNQDQQDFSKSDTRRYEQRPYEDDMYSESTEQTNTSLCLIQSEPVMARRYPCTNNLYASFHVDSSSRKTETLTMDNVEDDSTSQSPSSSFVTAQEQQQPKQQYGSISMSMRHAQRMFENSANTLSLRDSPASDTMDSTEMMTANSEQATRPPSSASLVSPTSSSLASPNSATANCPSENYRLNSMLNQTAAIFWPRIGQDINSSNENITKSILKKSPKDNSHEEQLNQRYNQLNSASEELKVHNGILKKRNSLDSTRTTSKIHPILKQRHSRDEINVTTSTNLGSSGSTSTVGPYIAQTVTVSAAPIQDYEQPQPRPIHSILKKSSSEEHPRRPILKKSSFDETNVNDKSSGEGVKPILKSSRYRGESKSESEAVGRSGLSGALKRHSEPTTPEAKVITQEEIFENVSTVAPTNSTCNAFSGPFVARIVQPGLSHNLRRKSHPIYEETRLQPLSLKLNKQPATIINPPSHQPPIVSAVGGAIAPPLHVSTQPQQDVLMINKSLPISKHSPDDTPKRYDATVDVVKELFESNVKIGDDVNSVKPELIDVANDLFDDVSSDCGNSIRWSDLSDA